MHAITKWWIWVGASLFAFATGLSGFCWWHGVWSYDEWLVYRCMDGECHPAWRDFYESRITAGDNVHWVIANSHPSVVLREGRSVTLQYFLDFDPFAGLPPFTGLVVEAQDGKLVCAYAYSCTWARQFFDIAGNEAGYFPFGYRRLPGRGAISISH